MQDKEVILEVQDEWKCGAGSGIIIPAILGVLEKLILAYGDKVTVEGACNALRELSDNALAIREDLIRVRAKNPG